MMIRKDAPRGSRGVRRRAGGFSLIELLTVIFIISLLIAILLPSLNNARNQAKRSATTGLIRAIEAGLEMFKSDNAVEFGRTNGYPPSFSHPRISDGSGNVVFSEQDAAEGRFPFRQSKPHVYGAHFLPAMLLGVDANGFVARRSVPKDLLDEPWKWYDPEPNGRSMLERQSLYLDSGDARLTPTRELIGTPPSNADRFPDWDDMGDLPVIVDSFDQPVLYYVANRSGSTRNMVEKDHRQDNVYPDGPPVYFHQDNMGFTGTNQGIGRNRGGADGWDFGGGPDHRIARPGEDLTAVDIDRQENKNTFARYILDVNAFRTLREPLTDKMPIRPVNSETFLLITAGPDGLFGTSDDVTNLPRRQ